MLLRDFLKYVEHLDPEEVIFVSQDTYNFFPLGKIKYVGKGLGVKLVAEKPQ